MQAASPMPPGAGEGLSRWSPRQQFRRWWQARLPLTDTWQLGQRNIYILPTTAGLTFALTLVVMLLAAINYQLNLGHALTFALAGAGIVSMHLTHGNLRGLTLHLKPAASVFAGDAAVLEVVATNPGRARYGLALRFEGTLAPAVQGPGAASGAADVSAARGAGRAGAESAASAQSGASSAGRSAAAGGPAAAAATPRPARALAWSDVAAGGQQVTHISWVPPRRGWHSVPTLVVETVFPFGLFCAWTVWRPAGRVLAWPRPEAAPPPLPVSAATAGAETQRQRASDGGEFDGVRPWRRGDTMRQVVWKKVARSNELVSRETAGSGRQELWLDWAQTGLAGNEPRLARLAAWVLAADRSGVPYGLKLPGLELPPAAGAAQRAAALDALALAP